MGTKTTIFKTQLLNPILDPSNGKYVLLTRNSESITHSMLNFLFNNFEDDEFDQRKFGDTVREQYVNLLMERFNSANPMAMMTGWAHGMSK